MENRSWAPMIISLCFPFHDGFSVNCAKINTSFLNLDCIATTVKKVTNNIRFWIRLCLCTGLYKENKTNFISTWNFQQLSGLYSWLCPWDLLLLINCTGKDQSKPVALMQGERLFIALEKVIYFLKNKKMPQIYTALKNTVVLVHWAWG